MTTQTEAAIPAEPMTHRQVLEALSGLLLGLFVTILASTVVSAALPRIVSELGGSQSAFTWVVTATLLAMTVTTPLWGKLADLFSRKLLVQIALVVFVVGSALAGLSQSAGMLIGFRVLQGVGAGGLTALSQVILADIISPRQRGRYMGFLGAVMAVGTVGGPLLGGVMTDSALGWRSTFYVGVPFAVIAIIVLQKTLHLPRVRRKVRIDYLGATLHHRRRPPPDDLGHPRGQPVRVGVRRPPRHGGGRRGPARPRHRRRAPCQGADPAAVAVPNRTFVLADPRERRGRCRDVRYVGLPEPVHADRPWQVADGDRPAQHPDGHRQPAVGVGDRPRSSPVRASGSAGWSSAVS